MQGTEIGDWLTRWRGLLPNPSLADLRRSERTMIIARAIGFPWALFQVLYYEHPYPSGLKTVGLLLVAFLAAGGFVIWLAHRRIKTLEQARLLAVSSLSFDVVVVAGFVWLYTFDPESALWGIVCFLPLEGAIRFQLFGALVAWAVGAGLYTIRDVWGSSRYDYPLLLNSITFRMGIVFIIGLVAGLMARDLMRQREQLAKALAELRDVDQLRSALVSMLAHDVRGPLTSIRLAHTTLLRKIEQLDRDVLLELVGIAESQSKRLERLATDLLDLARLEQGRLDLFIEDVSLRDAVDKALSYLERGATVEVDIDPELKVAADRERLQQIIVNLATNSLAYGEPPFRIQARASDHKVAVSFQDHGPGIPPDQESALFQAFPTRGEKGSIGLGLAIVKALAEAQGGEVAYERNEPKGACFRVVLPGSSSL